ncbi:zinc transporter 4 isoform X3 [Myotis myotis]|uniref:zinc transporter 4 isoform X3 n=1 Tax=Myotis myotis TaxID=51298 RepID=UPI001748D95F|nr:zinc transporter 4 isoform X3 [Myotis myotis]
MAGSGAWKRLKSLLRKDDAPLFLNDNSAFDFSDEAGDEGLPRFNKLRVVVADDGSETPERPVNGAHPALQADDDSLLDQDLPLTNSQLSLKVDPCDTCSRRRELLKQRKVKTRLAIAAVLYLLFMVGELVGGYIANSLAVMTDALHMLTDLSAIILTLLALWLSSKSPTKRFTFGFHRLGVPRHLHVDYIKEALMKIEDVHSVEDLNVWSLTSGKPMAIAHIQLIPGSSSKWEEVQSKARHLLLNTFGMYKCTIQLQSYRQDVDRTCANCQNASS